MAILYLANAIEGEWQQEIQCEFVRLCLYYDGEFDSFSGINGCIQSIILIIHRNSHNSKYGCSECDECKCSEQ